MSKVSLIATLLVMTGFAVGGAVAGWLGYRAGSTAERAASRHLVKLTEMGAELKRLRADNEKLASDVQELRTKFEQRVTVTPPSTRVAVPVLIPEPAESDVIALSAPAASKRRLKRVTASGEQVELDDGSIWEPDFTERDRLRSWSIGARVSVNHTGELLWDYRLVNQQAGETVDVRQVSPAVR